MVWLGVLFKAPPNDLNLRQFAEKVNLLVGRDLDNLVPQRCLDDLMKAGLAETNEVRVRASRWVIPPIRKCFSGDCPKPGRTSFTACADDVARAAVSGRGSPNIPELVPDRQRNAVKRFVIVRALQPCSVTVNPYRESSRTKLLQSPMGMLDAEYCLIDDPRSTVAVGTVSPSGPSIGTRDLSHVLLEPAKALAVLKDRTAKLIKGIPCGSRDHD